MKEKLQILPSDFNLPGIVIMFFESCGCNPDNPNENQYHFVIYRENDVVGGLIILTDNHIDFLVRIKHFSLRPALPHHYLCKKLASLVNLFAIEKGFRDIEIHEGIKGTPFYEMLQKALNEEKINIEAQELHHV